jgi:hypothetical protein
MSNRRWCCRWWSFVYRPFLRLYCLTPVIVISTIKMRRLRI